MKLNSDCIRDILLIVEGKTDLSSILRLNDIYNSDTSLFFKYSEKEVLYHINQCIMNNFIVGEMFINSCKIQYLSPKGHEFLENIRQENNWNKIKAISKDIGSLSINALFQISTNLITNLITTNFLKNS